MRRRRWPASPEWEALIRAAVLVGRRLASVDDLAKVLAVSPPASAVPGPDSEEER
ncbi:MAG: hypothetical protein RL139_1280 [Gemmatimonadota bacterium]|jgi:hypothetical protein